MSQTLEVTIQATLDGDPIPGFPSRKSITVDESTLFTYEHANDGDTTTFTTIPGSKLATVQALLLKSDQAVTVRLDGQSDAGIVLSAGGILIILDATIDAGATTNATINNNSGSTANVKGASIGT